MEIFRFFQRIGGIGGACQGTGADGGHVRHVIAFFQPLEIPFQHGKVAEHVMGKEHRLGPLHMGITGQNHIFVLFRSLKQRLFHSNQFSATRPICLFMYI